MYIDFDPFKIAMISGIGIFSGLKFFIRHKKTQSAVKNYNNFLANLGFSVAVLTPIIAFGGEEIFAGYDGWFTAIWGGIGIMMQMLILIIMGLINAISRYKNQGRCDD